MEKEKLKVVLERTIAPSEMEKEWGRSWGHTEEEGYLYRIGDFRLHFSQNVRNGDIYGYAELLGPSENVECYITCSKELEGVSYPTDFRVEPRPGSSRMDIGEARELARDLARACDVMEAVKDFFENSKHYELYCKGHGIEEKNVEVRDELISREALLGKILSRREGMPTSLGLWLGDDFKKVFRFIVSYRPEDGRLVGRDGLMAAFQEAFGHDADLSRENFGYAQEAICFAPVVSEGQLDDLTAGIESNHSEKYVPYLVNEVDFIDDEGECIQCVVVGYKPIDEACAAAEKWYRDTKQGFHYCALEVGPYDFYDRTVPASKRVRVRGFSEEARQGALDGLIADAEGKYSGVKKDESKNVLGDCGRDL